MLKSSVRLLRLLHVSYNLRNKIFTFISIHILGHLDFLGLLKIETARQPYENSETGRRK